MKECHFKLMSIFTLLAAVLFHYQNCGSKSANLSEGSTITQNLNSDPEVGVINPINTGSIQFLQSKTQVANSDVTLVAYGSCSQDQQGALLSWKIFDSTNSILAIGKSLCNQGTFEVIYQEIETLNCGNLKLSAYFGSQAQTDMLIEKACN